MRVSSKKYFMVLSASLVLVVALIIGATVGGNMLFEKQSKRLYDLKAEKRALENQELALKQAETEVKKHQELNAIAKSVVPQDKDQAKTVREIVKIAADNDIPIKSITFQNSTLGDAAPKAAAPSTSEGQAAAPKPAQPAISQLKPVDGIKGVYTLEIQVSSAGEVSYQNFLKFLEELEKNRRTAHVGAISLDPSNDGKRLNFNLTLNAYVKP